MKLTTLSIASSLLQVLWFLSVVVCRDRQGFFTDPCRVRSQICTDVIRVNLFYPANERHVPLLGLHRERLYIGVNSSLVCI